MRLIVLIAILLGVNNALQEVEYLQRYGYLDNDHGSAQSEKTLSAKDISPAVKKMQSMFGLPVTGVVDDATRQLMEKDRCGVKDIHITRHRRRAHRPFDRNVTYKVESNDLSPVVKIATETWTNATGIVFHQTDGDADIFIIWKPRIHTMNEENHSFGETDLAHATWPPVFTESRIDYQNGFRQIGEIHINLEKKFSKIVHSTSNQDSLIALMVHELGHILGLDHSSDTSSIMHPIMQRRQMYITKSEVNAINRLWGSLPTQLATKPSSDTGESPEACPAPVTCPAPVACSEPVTCQAPVTSPPKSCPHDWHHQWDNACYKIEWYRPHHFPEKYTFDAANRWCGEMAPGGRLASIHSKRDLDVVQAFIALRFVGSDGTVTWIGLRQVNGEFTWTNGMPMEYQHYKIEDNGGDCRLYCDGVLCTSKQMDVESAALQPSLDVHLSSAIGILMH